MVLAASPVLAQTTGDPDAEASMRFGPLAIKSTIALSNIGVDNNVFNAAEPDSPQSDFTMTFRPNTDLWLRLGRTWVTGFLGVDWVYYKRFASERSANSDYRLGVDRTFNRLSVKGMARRLNTRERPGYEIDARSQRHETEFDGRSEVRVQSSTHVGVRAWRKRTEFDRLQVFRDINLAQELNRTTTSRGLLVRHALTPLTSVTFEVSREADRFVFSPTRDADSTRIAATGVFQPLALINGTATIGYRNYDPLARDLAPYRGTTLATSLSYSFLGTTRFTVDAMRDIQPSLELAQPYYLETGLRLTVQRQVFGPFDAMARIGGRRLAYRDRGPVLNNLARRVDEVTEFSVGGGYRIGTDKRIGVNLVQENRASGIAAHDFSALRIGASMTYER
jgi:hypothetical protein